MSDSDLFLAMVKHDLTVFRTNTVAPVWKAYNHDVEGRGESPQAAIMDALRLIKERHGTR